MALICSAILVLLGSAITFAQSQTAAHDLINFQARVTDAIGNPVADGTYPATFVIHTHSVDVSDLWAENANVNVVGGIFTHNLGSVSPLDWSNALIADSMWLAVTFNGELLSPRTLLVSTATSHVSGAIEVEGNTNNTVSLRTLKHQLSQYGSDGGEQARLWGAGWGELVLDASGINTIADDVILTSNNGAGGLLHLRKASGAQGVSLWGGNVGMGATFALTNDVGTTTVFMDGDQSGDDAVQVPAGSISAIETLNEPGVASANEQTITTLTQFAHTVVESQVITAPSNGYVLAIGTCQFSIVHANGTTDSAYFGVSTNANFTTTGTLVHLLPSSAASGLYYDIVTVQAIFSVVAGANTINLLASERLGAYAVWNRQLSLVFIPTAYGTYEAPSAPGGSDDLTSAPGNGDFEAARLREELAIVKAKADETTRRLAKLEAEFERDQSAASVQMPK